MSRSQETLKIVIVGHVDHGKSTLIGRLLADTASVPQDRISAVQRRCTEQGKEMEYAFLLDALEEEQSQGITIDTTRIQFHSEKRDYVIIDAPGHKEFLKNMISGASDADAAFLLIDAQEGVREQTRRHASILKLLGVRQVHVVINKMDLLDYDQESFDQIVTDCQAALANAGLVARSYIPIAAKFGENIVHRSSNLTWYAGLTIIDTMDALTIEHSSHDAPVRLPVQDVYKFDHRRIIAGRLESGTLKAGDEIVCWPQGTRTRIKTLESWNLSEPPIELVQGLSVGVTLEDPLFLERGTLITNSDAPPLVGTHLTANVYWLGRNPLVMDRRYTIKITTQETSCEVKTIHRVYDSGDLSVISVEGGVPANFVGEVTLEAKQPLAFDPFTGVPETGRFVLMDGYEVCGGGIITGLAGEQSTDDHQEKEKSPAGAAKPLVLRKKLKRSIVVNQ
ncbi:GTP-binding protein [Heliobacterium chlorum]|uniref:GTP-binding protein n=1 Tax=Heliobacterium chlorum TaxID=2698 RepID=A0ABR7T0T2_HELCL|nr:GTP-binding protein [Heliobacterium chlorum]MBC9784393.1 GTP-binding protein [Heliobacterium chlorum]